MGVYNLLTLTGACPRCGAEETFEVQFRAGLLNLDEYSVGDRLRWDGDGNRPPMPRSASGDYAPEGYAECPSCDGDFFVDISIRGDVIRAAHVDERPAYKS